MQGFSNLSVCQNHWESLNKSTASDSCRSLEVPENCIPNKLERLWVHNHILKTTESLFKILEVRLLILCIPFVFSTSPLSIPIHIQTYTKT